MLRSKSLLDSLNRSRFCPDDLLVWPKMDVSRRSVSKDSFVFLQNEHHRSTLGTFAPLNSNQAMDVPSENAGET